MNSNLLCLAIGIFIGATPWLIGVAWMLLHEEAAQMEAYRNGVA